MRRHSTNSPEETAELATGVARRLSPGSIVALTGDLGAGKTAFVKAAAAALGVTEEITSPTYTIIAEYPGLVHMDLYRLQDAEEFELLGVEEHLRGDGIAMIEWAERAKEALPQDRTVWVEITFEEGDRRTIEIREPENG
ncbi:MAG: tRNA (adenosine(37)-N6)-threonylcarbamoyltransferase complex ATPase subunit type 1 TsaE [Alkalispirochaetaceae bacterium]